MKALRFTVNVEKNRYGSYSVSAPASVNTVCVLCRDVYERAIGKDVVGEVTFILRKIKGKAEDYIFPFRIRKEDLEIREKHGWGYAKCLDWLADAIDADELSEWAGKSKFSIEMEW